MLYRVVRPMRRKGSSHVYFVQRIPADVKARAAGLRLAVPVGPDTIPVTISPRAADIRLSLGTRDPSAAKVRQAAVAAYLEKVWRGLRQDAPVALTHRQATALAGELYRAWADEHRGRSVAMVHNPEARRWEPSEDDTGAAAEWAATVARWAVLEDDDLEPVLGPLVDRLLLARGIERVEARTRNDLLHAFWQALRDAFAARQRKAEGDYRPDPKAERFPEWQRAGQSLTSLVEDWWTEARAAGRAVSTYESYRNTVKRLVAFLGHDDASRVTADDVIRFKDHRLAEGVSATTVKNNDLAGLRAVFGWAVVNHRLPRTPAEGITIKLGRQERTRPKGFTEDERRAVLSHALRHKKARREHPKTWAAKRWAPWLCAYTGARLGEVLQLRKQDVRREGEHWIITITPEAGTVKGREAREVPLHAHLVELGFADFVREARDGHLFLNVRPGADPRGAWRTAKNRVREFVREVVTDRRVAPNHAWRHTFKTIGFEAGIQERVLDAICGHAPRHVGATYGDVTVPTKIAAIARFPRFGVEAKAGRGKRSR